MITQLAPATQYGHTTDPVEVLCATLDGKLAVHRSISDKGYTVTHVPSGFAARTRIRRKRDAINLMLRLEELGDWNFRNPFAKKWKSQMKTLWETVSKVERYN